MPPKTVTYDTTKVLLLFIAIAQAANSYFLYKANEDIGVIYKQTNSMSDALVTASKEVGRTEGRAQEKKENP